MASFLAHLVMDDISPGRWENDIRRGVHVTGMLVLPDWLIISAQQHPKRGWGVRIEADRIAEVGPNETLLERYPHDETRRAEGQVLSPGFVNTHTHLYGVLAHGIPLAKAPQSFWPFLHDFWWPLVEDRIDLPMLRAAAEWQCQLMLRSGITSFYDCLEAPNSLPGCLQAEAQVVTRHGLRAVLSFEATQRVSPENGQLGLQENYEFTRNRPPRRPGPGHDLLPYHLHLLRRFYPTGIPTSQRTGLSGAHAPLGRHLRIRAND